MLNTVLGSAIGGLVAGAVALGAAAAMKPAPALGPDSNGAYAMPVANTAAFNGGAFTGGALQCQPYEEAVLRRAIVDGREVTDVTCITRGGSSMPHNAYAQPVVYRDSQDVRPAVQTRTVTPARTRVVSRQSQDRRESDRSWGKTAMIIGGGAGGGAGLGGLIGGKKGALIGAAIGGGAATIYESTKR
ncbi:MAG: hypothetical protein ABI039_14850 [Vicinamibacterales bacterium]